MYESSIVMMPMDCLKAGLLFDSSSLSSADGCLHVSSVGLVCMHVVVTYENYGTLYQNTLGCVSKPYKCLCSFSDSSTICFASLWTVARVVGYGCVIDTLSHGYVHPHVDDDVS